MNSFNEQSNEKTKSDKKIKSKDIFKRTRSDFFLQKLFGYLSLKKKLEIIKYNKNMKNRMNININDYKEYLEKYSSIEIEIAPIQNKYVKFINHWIYFYFN